MPEPVLLPTLPRLLGVDLCRWGDRDTWRSPVPPESGVGCVCMARRRPLKSSGGACTVKKGSPPAASEALRSALEAPLACRVG